jgi:hypothetical protein
MSWISRRPIFQDIPWRSRKFHVRLGGLWEIDYLGASTLQGRSPTVTEGGGVVSGGVRFHVAEVSTPVYIFATNYGGKQKEDITVPWLIS